MVDLPAKNTQNQVEHEEWSYNNQRDKEDPVEHTSKGIIGLKIQMRMVSFHFRLHNFKISLEVKAKKAFEYLAVPCCSYPVKNRGPAFHGDTL